MPTSTKEHPYLTHSISHHGRVTLIPPDNEGRIRKPSTSEKSVRRQYRSHEQQQMGSTSRISPNLTIPSRRLFEDSSRYSIPNYPPPSFQEAMASPPVSVAPSVVSDDTGTYISAVQSFDQSFDQSFSDDASFASELNLTEEELSRLSTTAAHGSTIIADQVSPESPDSDTSSTTSSSSMEIVESPPQFMVDASFGERSNPSSPTSPQDGSFSVVERTAGGDSSTMPQTPTKHGHHRSLSLSPLRTLLPSHGRSSSTGSFLRSSTSTSNLLSRAASSPFFRSTTTLGSPTNESPRKKIFHSKVREKQRSGDEPMEAWEMLEAASGAENSSSTSSNRMSFMSSRSVATSRRGSMRRAHPPPLHIPQNYPPHPVLQIQRTDSPPIVTVRTRRFPPTSRVHVSSPLAHDAVLETALSVPLPSTPTSNPNVDPETPTTPGPPTPKRHYASRPLPRPPGIDGAAAHLLTQPLTPPAWVTSLPQLPPRYAATRPSGPASAPARTSNGTSNEGPLIDFRDSAVLEVSSPQTPQVRRRDRVDLLSDTDEESEMVTTPPQSPTRVTSPPSTPLSPTTPTSRSLPAQGPYSQLTELDMLAAALTDEGMRTGQEYETLLLIAEFNGPVNEPVTPTRARRNALATSPPRSAASSIIFPSVEPSTCTHPFLQGSIELERRRVTKDGRVKLKLSLLGSAVDKCGICFTQFKKGEVGAKGRTCQPGHAFHGVCLQKWVTATPPAREPRCPVCREPLKP